MLFLKFGYEGLGLFYTIIEKLAAQEKPVNSSVLKAQLKVGKKLEKCWQFMESIELIQSNNGETFNKQLLNFSEKYNIKNQKNKEKIIQWRENQKNIKNVTSSENVRNHPKVKLSKVKLSKVKKEEESEIDIYQKLFENFREEYPGNKNGFLVEFKNFKRHSDWMESISKLIPALEIELEHKAKRLKTGFAPQWKNLQTWINQRCWEQELEEIKIIPTQSKPDQRMNNGIADSAPDIAQMLRDKKLLAAQTTAQ